MSTMPRKVTKFIDGVKLELLKLGGVDEWEWYSESISDYMEWNKIEDSGELDDEDLLNALESGGVDNWDFYGESLGEFGEWVDYVKEQYNESGTLSGIDGYNEWVTQFTIKQQEELAKKQEQEEMISAKKAEEEAANKKEIIYQPIIDCIKKRGLTGDDVLTVHNKVLELPRFWSGLQSSDGQIAFNEAKRQAATLVEADDNVSNFLECARQLYAQYITQTETLNSVIDEIIEGL